MAKYPISKEFFPFNLFAPPMSEKFVLLAQKHMKTPKTALEESGAGRADAADSRLSGRRN